MFRVTQNPLSELTELSCQRHALCVNRRQSEFAGFVENLFYVEVLLWRLVHWVKCIVMAHISVLVSHLALVALVLVHQMSLFVDGGVNLHDLAFLVLGNSVACDFKVYVRPIRTEVFIEDLFTPRRHMRVEDIKRFAEQLVSKSSQEACCWHFNLFFLNGRSVHVAQRFDFSMSYAVIDAVLGI